MTCSNSLAREVAVARIELLDAVEVEFVGALVLAGYRAALAAPVDARTKVSALATRGDRRLP